MAKEIAIQWSLQDKENAPVNFDHSPKRGLGVYQPIKAEAKTSSSSSTFPQSPSRRPKPRSTGAFGRLLNEVKREQKDEVEEYDEKVAIETQCREAVALAMEWVSEDADCKIATDLQRSVEQEDKLAKQLEVSRGESEALSVAIQERRRVQAEAEAKAQREHDDAKCAAQLLDEEEKLTQLIEQDDDYAKRVYVALQDELLAEELRKQEEEAHEKERARLQAIVIADGEHARKTVLEEMEADRLAAEQQITADFVLARMQQNALHEAEEEGRLKQEQRDFIIARRLAVKTQRESHRLAKAKELQPSSRSFSTIAAVQKQWEDTDAIVEDVMDGICITLVLPYIRDLKTKACGRNRIELEAYRVVGVAEKNSGTATVDNTQYAAEFIIEGSKVAILDRDINYEYASDTGLLHIYIDRVRLDGAPIKDTDPAWAERESQRGVLGSIKNSFKRYFASSKASKK